MPVFAVLGSLAHKGAVLAILGIELGVEAALQELGEERLGCQIDLLQRMHSAVDLQNQIVGQRDAVTAMANQRRLKRAATNMRGITGSVQVPVPAERICNAV